MGKVTKSGMQIALHDADGPHECAGLMTNPTPGGQHGCQPHGNYDQIDTQHSQQRNEHAAILSRRLRGRLTAAE